MTTTTFTTGFQRALDAEPRLRPMVRLVDALCALVRPTDRMCSGCVWESIVKPLVVPLVGWGGGYMPEQATDNPRALRECVFTRSDLAALEARRIPATTDTEAWLRTSQAYDAFTDEPLARLKAADPANDHGIGRCTDS
jgi:hypothetical protein